MRTELHIIIYYGGPYDGLIAKGIEPLDGYIDTGGALALWYTINAKLLWGRKTNESNDLGEM